MNVYPISPIADYSFRLFLHYNIIQKRGGNAVGKCKLSLSSDCGVPWQILVGFRNENIRND